MVPRCPDEEVNDLEFWPGPRPLMFVKKTNPKHQIRKTILLHAKEKREAHKLEKSPVGVKFFYSTNPIS